MDGEFPLLLPCIPDWSFGTHPSVTLNKMSWCREMLRLNTELEKPDGGLPLPRSPIPGLGEVLIQHSCKHKLCLLRLPLPLAAPRASSLSRARLGPGESVFLQHVTAAGTVWRGAVARGQEWRGSCRVGHWAFHLYFGWLGISAHRRPPCALLTNSSDFK